jgi:hypothetical protein
VARMKVNGEGKIFCCALVMDIPALLEILVTRLLFIDFTVSKGGVSWDEFSEAESREYSGRLHVFFSRRTRFLQSLSLSS